MLWLKEHHAKDKLGKPLQSWWEDLYETCEPFCFNLVPVQTFAGHVAYIRPKSRLSCYVAWGHVACRWQRICLQHTSYPVYTDTHGGRWHVVGRGYASSTPIQYILPYAVIGGMLLNRISLQHVSYPVHTAIDQDWWCILFRKSPVLHVEIPLYISYIYPIF